MRSVRALSMRQGDSRRPGTAHAVWSRMNLDIFDLWLAHALGLALLALVASLGIGLLLFGGFSLLRARHTT